MERRSAPWPGQRQRHHRHYHHRRCNSHRVPSQPGVPIPCRLNGQRVNPVMVARRHRMALFFQSVSWVSLYHPRGRLDRGPLSTRGDLYRCFNESPLRPCDPQRAAGRRLLAEPAEPGVPERRGQLDGCQRRWLDPEGHRTGAGIAGQRRHHRRHPTDVRLQQLDPKFTPAVAPLYRIQLLDGGGNVIGDRTAEQGAGSTTYASDVNLAYDTNYQWRVRAEFEGRAGSVVGGGGVQDAAGSGGRWRVHRRCRVAALDWRPAKPSASSSACTTTSAIDLGRNSTP